MSIECSSNSSAILQRLSGQSIVRTHTVRFAPKNRMTGKLWQIQRSKQGIHALRKEVWESAQVGDIL